MNKIFNIFAVSLVMATVLLLPDNLTGSSRVQVCLAMEKMKFYAGEEVVLRVSVKNITEKMVSFVVYDPPERMDIYSSPRGDVADFTTFRPVVYDMEGRNAELIVPYVVKSESAEKVMAWMKKREIVLGPGETFVHRQNLKKIYRLDKDRDYRVKLHFFPDAAVREGGVIVSSNEIMFNISREPGFAGSGAAKDSVLLQPSEVVQLLLGAEKENRWDRALKYIDLSRFIYSYPAFSEKYIRADDYDKKKIENQFVRYLKSSKRDTLYGFRIVNEKVEESGIVAYVEVAAERKGAVRPEMFRYMYRLERKNKKSGLWLVSGLEASVMKGKIK